MIKKVKKENQLITKGIEVGHIFYFGDKYSKPLKCSVDLQDGKKVDVKMGSYGIGVSRLVGAIIEACHDESGIKWPESVSPFKVGLINLKSGETECDAACDEVYHKLLKKKIEVLYDDRQARAGTKFADMDLIGLPWQLVIGPRCLKTGTVEMKNRSSGERHDLSIESALARLLV